MGVLRGVLGLSADMADNLVGDAKEVVLRRLEGVEGSVFFLLAASFPVGFVPTANSSK